MLQRQLTQATLQAEAAAEDCEAAASAQSERTIRQLLEQRDTANAALMVQHPVCHRVKRTARW